MAVKLEEERLQVIPVDGETDSESETVPVKLFMKDMLRVEVAEAPVAIDMVVGLAVIEKSFTVMVTIEVRDLEPPLPVTVTV